MRRPSSVFFMVVTILPALGCSASRHGPGDAGRDAGDDPDPARPPLRCLRPGPGPYPLLFSDATEELGLGTGGLRITAGAATVADIDGDRWPDLALTRGKSLRDDPASPAGHYRLLRNLGGSGFQDVTFMSGLFATADGLSTRASTFVLFADLDNDGDQDAFSAVFEDFSNQAALADHSQVLLNDGTGRFRLAPAQSFTSAATDPVVSAAVLDFDRDGLLDLFVGHHYARFGYPETAVQDNLFRGDGHGGFVDVTAAAGLSTLYPNALNLATGTAHKPTWGVSACDIDGDGWSDLLASSYGRQFNALYRNLGGQFEDLSQASGFAADGNRDFSDNQFFLCYCQARTGEPACAGAARPSINCSGLENAWRPGIDDQPWRLGGNSSNTVCGDFDNDGDIDLLQVELAHWHIGQSSDRSEILLNDGFPAVPLRRPGNQATGLARKHESADWNEGDLGAAAADFDNDGRLDLVLASSDYPGTYSLLWQQQPDGSFLEVGLSSGARVHRSHGIAIIDFDRDGDYDLLLGTSLMRWRSEDQPPPPADAFAYLLRNQTGQASNRLIFHLEGSGPPGANVDAIGSRITVEAGGRIFTRQVQGGHGLTGFQHDSLVIIGIGESCAAERVTIDWPDAAGSRASWENIPANYVLLVRQGQPPRFITLEQYLQRL